jgi:hypothetical protein
LAPLFLFGFLGCSDDAPAGPGGSGGSSADPDGSCPDDGLNQGPPIEIAFAAPTLFPVAAEPERVVAGDLNDDGHIDLVLADGAKLNPVVVLYGDGTGGFAPPEAAGMAPGFDCAVGDMDGDGVDDLTIARQPIPPEAAVVTVHFGGASFPNDVGEIVASAETAGSRSVEVGDFDADGRLDVAVFTGVGVGVAFNEGSRMFTPIGLIGEGIQESAYAVAAVDVASLDSDAGLEILGLSGTGAWRRYDVANGRTSQATSVGTVTPGSGARAPGDFDGDGLDDLLRAAKGGLHVFWNDGKFEQPDLFCVSENLSEGVAGVASADLDGDGRPDLIASTRTKQLVILGGAGSRRFREPFMLPSDPPGDVITADLNEDGALDIVVASAPTGGGGQIEVHLAAK